MLIFSIPVLIRHLWHLKTLVFLHWCLIHTVLLDHNNTSHVATWLPYFRSHLRVGWWKVACTNGALYLNVTCWNVAQTQFLLHCHNVALL